MSVDRVFPLKFVHGTTEVYLHESVLVAFQGAIQKEGNNEKFGVIIGSQSTDKETYWIEKITTPYTEDRSTVTSFLLQDPHHQLSVDEAFEHSNGELGYLGTWHTHPESCPRPSEIDKRDWMRCVSNNSDRQLFFFIIGRTEISVFKKTKRDFMKMAKG